MRFLVLNILLSISLLINAQIYSTAQLNNQYNSGFQSTSYYNQPTRGYNNSYNNVNYNNSKFGYRTSTGYSTYKESFNLNSIYSGETYYIPSYSSDPNCSDENSSYKGGPRKVSGGGWITWISWGMWNGVPSSASNEDMYAYYDYVQSGGAKSYTDWYAWINDPGDPFADPIGEPFILLIMIILYAIYKKKNLIKLGNI